MSKWQDMIEVGQVREVTDLGGMLVCPQPRTYCILDLGTRLIVTKYGYEVYYDLNPYYSLRRYEGEMAVTITTLDGQ